MVTTFFYTLFLIATGYLARCMQEESNKMSSFQKGYDAGRLDAINEMEDAETPRDKAESSDYLKDRE